MSAPLSLVVDNIISALVARRHRLGIRQDTLAAQLNINKNVLCSWEVRRKQPEFASLVQWARALDLMVRLIPVEGRARKSARKDPQWKMNVKRAA